MISLSGAVLVIVVMSGSGVAVTQIDFPSMAQCIAAQEKGFIRGGDHPNYPPDTRHFCVENSAEEGRG
jgi:hypothetical protein